MCQFVKNLIHFFLFPSFNLGSDCMCYPWEKYSIKTLQFFKKGNRQFPFSKYKRKKTNSLCFKSDICSPPFGFVLLIANICYLKKSSYCFGESERGNCFWNNSTTLNRTFNSVLINRIECWLLFK